MLTSPPTMVILEIVTPRVILDCDTANEVDDQFAIACALGSPEGILDVLAVISCRNTTAHGPTSRDLYQEEAERVVALYAGKVPCIPGAEQPMEDRRTLVGSEGLDFLVEETRKGPLTVISTGPATDVASLVLAAPEVRENVRVVWLGGFGDKESYRRFKFGELNGRADIATWWALLETPMNLLQVPGWPGPAKVVVLAEPYAEELRSLKRLVADYLAEILVEWAEGYSSNLDKEGEKILWDVSCVATVADEEAVRVEPLAIPDLDATGTHDWRRTQRGRTVDALVDLDAARVLWGLCEALLGLPAT